MKCRNNFDSKAFETVVNLLSNGEVLPIIYWNTILIEIWECHIKANWLLIYAKNDDKLILVLTRTGSYSDLFK